MKINQFAHLQLTPDQKAHELHQIGFLNCDAQNDPDLNHIWLQFIGLALPHLKTFPTKEAKFKTLLASPTQNILEYSAHETVDLDSFYLVALQLLGFEPEVDFAVAKPVAEMERLGLYHASSLDERMQLIGAWYDLLCTFTKNGQTLLDQLAAQGYFTRFFDLPAIKKPLFFNGKAQPIFDTRTLIREVVYIESDLDTDGDGQLDLLKAEIIRPRDTEHGLKVPVLYTASPYNQGINEALADKLMHPANVKLTHKTPTNTTYDEIKYHASESLETERRTVQGRSTRAEETFSCEKSYSLNDYFLARGFAVIYAAGIGTLDSDGFRTCGSTAETASTTAVIEWLTGERRAFTNKTDNIEVRAWWCNKKVAMTGKSYLGTLATAAATTGVKGLETIISEAAISSWYDYYRDGGLVVSPDGFVGEDADILAEECFSRRKNAGEFIKIADKWQEALAQITADQDRKTGNYNQFWDERNYLNNVQNITCDVVMVHGLNDWNVKPRNVYQLQEKLAQLPLKHKLILHQGEHIYINNFQSLDFTDMMNLWLSYKLYDVQNDAAEILPDVLVQDNVTPATWTKYTTWKGPKKQILYPTTAGELLATPTVGQVSFHDQLSEAEFEMYQSDLTAWKQDIVREKQTPLSETRLLFKTPELTEELLLSGTPKLTVKVASSVDHGLLSAMLVDFGEAKRLTQKPALLSPKAITLGYDWRQNDLVEFKLAPKTKHKLISKGHRNLQNRTNLWQNNDLVADEFYEVEIPLQPTFYRLPKGRQLGLIIYATDMTATLRGNEDITYTLELADCHLELPLH
ncbi:MAG: Xaa-Pro dipeptidyl-peptidase [Lactobacillus sp.]|nr:Xaa-Pro dipeptidyl-peptidase [Lactobacillus sp.]